jgi:hypothetical protein
MRHNGWIRMLLNGGANTEVMDAEGWRALHFAAGYGSEKVGVVNGGIVDA